MKEAGAADLWLNFTFDELSPLLGIDPANMYKAIRTVGPEHCTLSSDAGEPLFPNSVESFVCCAATWRLLAARRMRSTPCAL